MPSVYILPDQQLVECGTAEAVLRAALRAGVPFAHACGGHASCSTCRVVVVEGWAACGERTAKERVIAERLGFGPEFRLACQTRVSAPVTMRRLVLDDTDVSSPTSVPDRDGRPADRRAGCSAAGVAVRPRPIGQEVRAAVLFADIRGFTAFAEALLPYDVLHVLQRHLRDVTARRRAPWWRRHELHGRRHHGPVRSRAPRIIEPRAVRAGLAMLAEADRRRPQLEELYGRSFDLNVGLHHGSAIVGSVWGGPASVTAIGDTVNLASRIEQANKIHGTRFLMSEATFGELGDDVIVGRTFSCELPGKAGEHTLIEVLGTG